MWSQFNSDFQTAEILQAKGIIKNKETAQFSVISRTGKKITIQMKSVAWKDLQNVKLALFSNQIKMPLANQNSNQRYWFEYLPEKKTLLIAYNRCIEQEGKPFAEFVENAFAVADKEKAEKVVVDLRRNGGGDSAIMSPLLDALKKRPQLIEKGKLFVLMGRSTFSSGFMNARELQVHTNAILIGEPSGQNPNAFGEVREFLLPNNKLKVRYSTKFFKLADGESKTFLPVDIKVDRTFADFASGRDATLERALKYNSAK
jgi:C-terminal processing protease CtpA/Prc